MKIASYSLTTQTSHDQSAQYSVNEFLHAWGDTPPSLTTGQTGISQNGVQVTLSSAGLQKQAAETSAVNGGDGNITDPKTLLLKQIIEHMTGQKIKLLDLSQNQPAQVTIAGHSGTTGSGSEDIKTITYSESQQTTLQAGGVVNTTDGKQIPFSLNLVMQQQYSQTTTSVVRTGNATAENDPLVVNFNGTAAQLSDQRFAFDLNSNGSTKQINLPMPGTGFLVLDKNNSGKIVNGSELFGPTTGNGFGELAQYDTDHNGWIDENDPIYSQLKVWQPDAKGGGALSSLASLGIGAISLQAAATPFNIKNSSDQLMASVTASSVALNNNGTADSVQQIDLTA